ncbi:zf-CCHC domain-containing protein/UBN2 domain-containing protein [Gossypium australe]|uniref:Zf-CCHC domain-containing protein/UBN2 domain-containing protein n=1 Tax=Gossypium australe TaxID=47621 RepID=A0A5B6WR08_9ROSI|nr:zf-CCHC domain-containing protein/UBN2 domain-containing protein [Gossypium australe]
MQTLFCALGLNEYSRVSSCSNVNEIWDKLKVTHEGTSQVKKSKVGILTLSYETFKTEPKEDIKAISDRFTIIINGLKSYGETYPTEEVVRNILRSLAKSWEANVTVIEEAKNLETLTLDKIIDSLFTHEMRLSKGVKEAKNEKKMVGVSLKSTTNEDSESSEEVDEDKGIAMFARRFKKFMRSSKQKLKAHVATWSDRDPSENKDQEVANFFLMAIDDSKVTYNSSISVSYSFDELQDAYDELGLEFETMVSKYKKTISKLKDENSSLSKANHELKSKVHDMQPTINDFEKNQNLHNLLSKVHDDHPEKLELLEKENSSSNKVSLKEEEHCFKVGNSSKKSWYLDSGCSRHMTDDKSHFIKLKPKGGG